MGVYSLVFKPAVEKDLRSIPTPIISWIMDRMEELASAPFPRTAVKLSGAENLHRLRVGNYRIVYEVDREAQVVMVHYVPHRRDVYRKLP